MAVAEPAGAAASLVARLPQWCEEIERALDLTDTLPNQGRKGSSWGSIQWRRRSYYLHAKLQRMKRQAAKPKAVSRHLEAHWLVAAGLSEPNTSVRIGAGLGQSASANPS